MANQNCIVRCFRRQHAWLTPLAFAGSVTLTVALACVIMARFGFPPCFEENDDVGIMLAVSGVGKLFATGDVPWLNIVLSRTLFALYALERSFPWYGLLHWAMLLGTLWVLVYLVSAVQDRLTFGLIAVCLALAFLLFLPTMLYLQWTKTAYLASTASFLGMATCLLAAPSRRAPRILLFITLVICGALGIAGFCLRKNAWFLALLLSTPMVVVTLCIAGRQLKIRLLELAGALVLIGAIPVCNHMQEKHYEHNEQWSRWRSLNKAKEPFQNIWIRPDDVSDAVLHAADWSRNDYAMLLHWGYFDEDVFSPERVAAAAGILKQIHRKRSHHALNQDLRRLGGWPILLCAGLLLGAAIAASENKKWAFAAAMAGSIAVVGLLAYLLFRLRLPPRVAFPPLFSIPWGVLLASSFRNGRPTDKGEGGKAVIAISLCCLALGTAVMDRDGYWRCAIRTLRTRAEQSRAVQQAFQRLAPDLAEPVTLITWGRNFPFEALLPFQRMPLPSWLSLVGLGTGNQSPNRRREFAVLGESRLLPIALRNDVYWVLPRSDTKLADLLCCYYREHEGLGIAFSEEHPAFRIKWRGKEYGLFRLRRLSEQ